MLSCLKVKLHILETITRYGQSQLTFTVNFCNLKDSSQITEQRPFCRFCHSQILQQLFEKLCCFFFFFPHGFAIWILKYNSSRLQLVILNLRARLTF